MATSVSRSERYMVWSKKMLGGQKFEVQSVVLQWHGQQPASFFASGIQKFTDRIGQMFV